jgi:hypothetical protein
LGDFVSRGCALIHLIAPFSEVNFPTWLFLPLGHVIRTRQMLPFYTGDKTVSLPRTDCETALAKMDRKPEMGARSL